MIITIPGIITIVTIIGILSVLGAIALFIYTVLRKEHEFQERQKSTFTQYEEIIKKANREAAEIMEKATIAAQFVLTQTKGTNENLEKDYDQVIQKIAEKQIHSLNQDASGLKKGYEDKLLQVEKTIDQNTTQMIHNTANNIDKQLAIFTQNLISHSTKSAQAVDEKTKDMIEQAESEIAEYKKIKLEKIDGAIMQLLQKTYHDILGRSIPPNIHQEMILEALEKAKKEGVFEL